MYEHQKSVKNERLLNFWLHCNEDKFFYINNAHVITNTDKTSLFWPLWKKYSFHQFLNYQNFTLPVISLFYSYVNLVCEKPKKARKFRLRAQKKFRNFYVNFSCEDNLRFLKNLDKKVHNFEIYLLNFVISFFLGLLVLPIKILENTS